MRALIENSSGTHARVNGRWPARRVTTIAPVNVPDAPAHSNSHRSWIWHCADRRHRAGLRGRNHQGRIRFHEWLGDSWGVLFSHPKDFTPVCTTELGYMARLKPEFDKRNARSSASASIPVDKHKTGRTTSRRRRATRRTIPMIGDTDLDDREAVRHAAGDDRRQRRGRTAADNQTVRTVFIVGPDKKIKLIIVYPMTTGRNFDEVLRVLDSLQLTAKHGCRRRSTGSPART